MLTKITVYQFHLNIVMANYIFSVRDEHLIWKIGDLNVIFSIDLKYQRTGSLPGRTDTFLKEPFLQSTSKFREYSIQDQII